MIITQNGYAPVDIDQIPLPCPFCGGAAELEQVAHAQTTKGRVAIVYSQQTLHADTFWFTCESCDATTGGHHDSAQKAVEAWNRRQMQ